MVGHREPSLPSLVLEPFLTMGRQGGSVPIHPQEAPWMALFPCAVGLHRYAGPQSSAYLGIVSGSQSARSKLRLCTRHTSDWIDYLEGLFVLAAIGDVTQTENELVDMGCASCGALDPSWNAFANVYQRGQEPRVYFAALCDGHVADFCERASIAI